MNRPTLALPSLSLRTKLLLLNAMVVLALVLLSLQAWRASSLQDREQLRQVELAEALHQSKQADMLHDALYAHVLASLLVGEVQGLTHDDVQRQVLNDFRSLDDALLAVAKSGLPAALEEKLAQVRKAATGYGGAALAIAQAARSDRAEALAALPAFNEHFKQLLHALDEQGSALRDTLQAAQAAAAVKAEESRHALLWNCAMTILIASVSVALITEAIRRRLRSLGDIAQAIANGDHAQRTASLQSDELGDLGRAIDRMAASLGGLIGTMRNDARRDGFAKRLVEALDMADREVQVAAIAARAMAEVSPRHTMELLVSDSSQAQMERAAEHPEAGAPGCAVASPYDCVAVRRGSAVAFDNSESLNACTHLRGRACGAVAAVCVPVTFMGRAIGVLHAAGATDQPLAAEQVHQLGALGAQIGMRIGTVRAFEKTQLQASTDALTGLPNRRTLEQRMHTLSRGTSPYAVVMCDLDHFKALNDTYGHAAGDTALRLFAKTLQAALRSSDLAGRWGGEEFAFVLQGADANAADEMVQRLRQGLATSIQITKGPRFTASFGIADSSMASRAEQLVQMADVAMYRAKTSGRDRACVAEHGAQPDAAPIRMAELDGPGIDVARGEMPISEMG
jgi:diguanylate cyclase (GGDEF)-like protein